LLVRVSSMMREATRRRRTVPAVQSPLSAILKMVPAAQSPMSAILKVARTRYVLAFLGVAAFAGLPRDSDSAADAGGVPVEFSISAEDVVTPGGRAIQGLPPLQIKATLVGTDTRYTLRDLDMRIGGIELAGEITVDSSAAIPNVTGSLTSRNLDLAALLSAESSEAGAPRDRLFPATNLPMDVPSAFNAEIDLHAAEVKLSPFDLADVEAKLTLANGTLTVDSLRGQLGGGTIEGSMALFAATDPPVVELRAKLKGLLPEKLPEVAAASNVRGAKTDLTLDLRGRGRSIADILGSSNGQLLVSVGPGQIGEAATGASLLGAVFAILSDLNPLSVKQKQTKLDCAVLNFRVQDGVAGSKAGVALQTDSYNILGGGIVDLGSERIDLAGKPKRRSKGVLGLLGVEANVSVGGTLRQPEVTTGASVGVGTVGRVGAAWMTGGMTLIAEGILDQVKFGDDVCAVARAAAPAR
jgi:hypothetical protein